MPVPVECPNCGVGHLHAFVYVEAEEGARFEVVGPATAGTESVRVRLNASGAVQQPEEAHLSCCACDWDRDAFIEWVE